MTASSAVDRVREAYQRIRETDRPEIWIAMRDEADAIREATLIDQRAARGTRLPLAGFIAAIKDNIDVEGLPTTAGAPSFSYVPSSDATAVARLRAAGALVIGKTNLDQFATGLVGTRSPYGAVRNAWDPTLISGGSSSGSAVATALGLVDIALGTDTAGSGRVPAALNGIVGIKPTRGLIPTTGVVPACRSLDCVSVFARELDLACRVARILASDDDHDRRTRRAGTSIRADITSAALAGVSRIAVPLPAQLEGLDRGWAHAFDATVATLEDAGVEVTRIDISPLLDAASLLYDGAFVAERYAAVGHHVESHRELIGRGLDPTVAAIILNSSTIPAARVYADQELLDRYAQQARELLGGCGALLTPTTTSHPSIEQVDADPFGANARLGRYTNFANLLDMCSIAIPAGSVNGLPFGVMLTAGAFEDQVLEHFAHLINTPAIELFVVGAHLRGQSLNYQLVSAGGSFLTTAATSADYRLYALPGAVERPGMIRAASGGTSIAGELWRLPADGFGRLVSSIPGPLGVGKVCLADKRLVPGFLCEADGLTDAEEITAYGGWVNWQVSR